MAKAFLGDQTDGSILVIRSSHQKSFYYANAAVLWFILLVKTPRRRSLIILHCIFNSLYVYYYL